MQQLHRGGYHGHAVIFHASQTINVVNSFEAIPSAAELVVSDATLFSLLQHSLRDIP
jgi:hypothetical protein